MKIVNYIQLSFVCSFLLCIGHHFRQFLVHLSRIAIAAQLQSEPFSLRSDDFYHSPHNEIFMLLFFLNCSTINNWNSWKNKCWVDLGYSKNFLRNKSRKHFAKHRWTTIRLVSLIHRSRCIRNCNRLQWQRSVSEWFMGICYMLCAFIMWQASEAINFPCKNIVFFRNFHAFSVNFFSSKF